MNKIVVSCLALLLLTCSFQVLAALEDEVRAGAEQHEELLKTMRLYTDPELNAYVSAVGNRLAANSSMSGIPWNFFIVDDESINAFATQGGYVYVHRGLMTYLTSEAQLAAVMAHEIAHVTERHLARQRGAAGLGKLFSVVSSIAIMNSNVGEAIDIWNAARLSGYGRDMELEADQVGATILYASSYDPQAIIEVLSLLKDHETFMSKQAGGQGGTYHGVFATHPRSDERLLEVVGQAGQLPPGEAFRGRDEYRQVMDGQIFGVNDSANAPPGFLRFAHRGLGITLVYPDSWQLQVDGAQVTLSAETLPNDLVLQVERMADPGMQPDDLLMTRFQVDKLSSSQPAYEEDDRRDEGRRALIEREWGAQRVAVIKVGGNAYYFASSAPELDEDADDAFVEVIGSFRRANANDYPPQQIKEIYYRRLAPGETFIDLARESSVLGAAAEDQLRLMNGYYPSGQPQPGTWMKLIKSTAP